MKPPRDKSLVHYQDHDQAHDLLRETMFDLAAWPPAAWPKKRGRKAHRSQGYRLVGAGIVGIKLETVWLNGGLWTSLEAVDRFVRRVTAAKAARRRQQQRPAYGDVATAILSSSGVRPRSEVTS